MPSSRRPDSTDTSACRTANRARASAGASTTTADKQTIAQPAVLVVVEGQQYGNAVVWEVSYWRIMIVQPNPHVVSPRTVSENPSKSI